MSGRVFDLRRDRAILVELLSPAGQSRLALTQTGLESFSTAIFTTQMRDDA